MGPVRRYVVDQTESVVDGYGTVVVQGFVFSLGTSSALSVCRTYEPDTSGHYVERPAILARHDARGPRWITRAEIEIRQGVAQLLLADTRWKTVKNRYQLKDQPGHVDVFHWSNDGLAIAEITGATLEPPAWCRDEVTFDPRYEDAQLAVYPYGQWSGAG